MYKKQKQLKSFLDFNIENTELFSRNSVITIIRAMLEPVANQNTASLIFTRLKNKEGLESLIKRLEYCNNVEIIDTTTPNVLIKDDYIELEFIVLTSARYSFTLLWDYSADPDKNYTKIYFLVNSKTVNDIFEILQSNIAVDYREKFYLHKPERRENELLNESLTNVLKKLNSNIEENAYRENDSLVVDLSDEIDNDEKIREISHEIKNQLSILDVYTRIIEKQSGKSKNTDVIKKSLAIINLQLNNLKNYENDRIQEVVIQDIVDDSVNMFEEILKESNNKIEYKNASFDIHCFVDENKLLSVLNNIIKNANESTKNDNIVVELDIDNNYCSLKISNHGEPIEKQAQDKIFEKGFTTKQKGTGIGLYACKNYIEEFGGKLSLLKSNETITTFEIKLPMH